MTLVDRFACYCGRVKQSLSTGHIIMTLNFLLSPSALLLADMNLLWLACSAEITSARNISLTLDAWWNLTKLIKHKGGVKSAFKNRLKLTLLYWKLVLLSSSGSGSTWKVKSGPWGKVCNGLAHHQPPNIQLFVGCTLVFRVGKGQGNVEMMVRGSGEGQVNVRWSSGEV